MEAKVAFLSDFDGTVISSTITDVLYAQFAACGLEYSRMWDRGEISTMEEIQSSFRTISANRQEMESVLAGISIGVGFSGFYQYCQDHKIPLAIVSDGLEWYIRFILNRNGFDNLQVYANQIEFLKNGFHFSFPWHHPDMPLAGVCKACVVRDFQKQGYQVVFIGDGKSDQEGAMVADWVFARGSLLPFCREHGVPAIPFKDFNDLLSKWIDLDCIHQDG